MKKLFLGSSDLLAAELLMVMILLILMNYIALGLDTDYLLLLLGTFIFSTY